METNHKLESLMKASVAPGPYLDGYGITLRQHFAGLAMGAICYHSDYPNAGPELVAAAAVELADALLAELTKDKT